ncbi:hypothetical protein D3C72_1905160 [compost metagenome]
MNPCNEIRVGDVLNDRRLVNDARLSGHLFGNLRKDAFHDALAGAVEQLPAKLERLGIGRCIQQLLCIKTRVPDLQRFHL